MRQALDVGEQATRKAEQVQNQINQLDDERTDMVREYRTLLQRRDAADLYAKQQELVVASQREEIASLTEQLARSTTSPLRLFRCFSHGRRSQGFRRRRSAVQES